MQKFLYLIVLSILGLSACSSPTLTEENSLPVSVATPDAAQEPGSFSSAAEKNCADDEYLCIGLVTDTALINDKSFNQAAWEGVNRSVTDLIAQVEYKESTTSADYLPNIVYFAEKDFDVIVTVGFSQRVVTFLAAERYPEINFIGVDQNQFSEIDNVVGLIFPEKKAGFLAGALAAMASETGNIGAVLSTNMSPSVVKYKEGFEAGAFAINPDIIITHAFHPGGTSEGFSDPEWGAETAREMIANGADVIFGATGRTGAGALIEAAQSPHVICIGAESDQYDLLPEARPCLISSAIKQISNNVFELAARSTLDGFPSGNVSGDVKLSPFHDFESLISAEAKAVLSQLNQGMLDGSIPIDGSYMHPKPPSVFLLES